MVDTRGERRVIGGKASEFEGTQWIRGFKEGETQLRILEPAGDWWRFREHYDASLGYFACNSSVENGKEPDPDNCIGCASPAERTQNRSLKFAFNAINSDGRVQVFKLGSKIRGIIRKREQALGADVLQRRDIVIIRTGTGFGGETGTQYSYEWGEEYDLEDKWPDESQYHDLGEVVTASYWDAVDKLEAGVGEDGEVEGEDIADGHEPIEEEAPKAAPAKRAAAKKAAPAKKTTATRTRLGAKTEPEPVEDVTPDEPGPDGDIGDAVTVDEEVVASVMDKIRDLETDDVRALLEKYEVDFKARDPRPRLMAVAEQALIDGILPPF